MTAAAQEQEHFFTRNKAFFKTLFPLLITIALQKLIAFSVNMADNMMLGTYDQAALSGAATVNQIFFLIQQAAMAIGDSIVILGSQYWGQQKSGPICKITGTALKTGLAMGIGIILLCGFFPSQLISIFTKDTAIIQQGVAYLGLLKYSFLLFIITNILMAALRCVGTVQISFWISLISLVINVGINYTLIFGHFGCPEMGIRGAAVGTLIARMVELLILVFYLLKIDKKLHFSENAPFRKDTALALDFNRVCLHTMTNAILWAVSVPMQTAILGHLSSDAIAANSVATTFYQYLKVVIQAMASASGVMVGAAVGSGQLKRIKEEARTLSLIDFLIGLVLALLLFLLRIPLLSMYNLTDTAMKMSNDLIILMSIIMIGMSYQMPVSTGIIRGGGDTKFVLRMNTISVWAIVMPLSFMSAFWWKWPVVWVVLMIQSDQIFKAIPVFLRFRSYKWIKKLTRDDV